MGGGCLESDARGGKIKKLGSGIAPELVFWWALRDSNPQPRDYESPALTVAPRARYEKGGDRSRRQQLHGGDKGVRTPDLVTASHALSQLSYIPVRWCASYINRLTAGVNTQFEKSAPILPGLSRPASALPRYHHSAASPSKSNVRFRGSKRGRFGKKLLLGDVAGGGAAPEHGPRHRTLPRACRSGQNPCRAAGNCPMRHARQQPSEKNELPGRTAP